MVGTLQVVSRWLANHASAFIIAIAAFTFFLPEAFEWVRGNTQTFILGLIMLTMGLTLTTTDFQILARRPLDIFIGACAQFVIMPLVAYTLVHLFRLEPALALGILLVGCCPGGVSSNIMSFLCKGDVAYSVGMTCASTLLAPVMTPLLMQLTAGEIIEIDAVGMFLNILIDYTCWCRMLVELSLCLEARVPYIAVAHAWAERDLLSLHRRRCDQYGA